MISVLSRLVGFFWFLSPPFFFFFLSFRYCKITTCRRLYYYAVPGIVSGNEHRDNSSVYDCFKGGKVTLFSKCLLGERLKWLTDDCVSYNLRRQFVRGHQQIGREKRSYPKSLGLGTTTCVM